MPMRVCTVPGCPTLVPAGGKDNRCAEHRKQAGRERSRRRPELRYYNSPAHKRWRVAVLSRDPVCVLCRQAKSTVADHYPLSVVDLIARRLPLDRLENGRGLCASCHGKETARMQPGGWNV